MNTARKYVLGLIFLFMGWQVYGTLNQPGAVNPNITQANITSTVCVPNWSASVRPPTSYTSPIKERLCKEQNCGDSSNYELDHYVSIVLGGSPTDLKNLVLQPYPEARQKDTVENYLHRQVCSNKMTLIAAQKALYTWEDVYKKISSGFGSAVDDSLDEDDF